MSRWKAAGIHLSISLAIGLLVGALLFGVWYPPPYFHAAGADELILMAQIDGAQRSDALFVNGGDVIVSVAARNDWASLTSVPRPPYGLARYAIPTRMQIDAPLGMPAARRTIDGLVFNFRNVWEFEAACTATCGDLSGGFAALEATNNARRGTVPPSTTLRGTMKDGLTRA